jgi:hypothetical protein
MRNRSSGDSSFARHIFYPRRFVRDNFRPRRFTNLHHSLIPCKLMLTAVRPTIKGFRNIPNSGPTNPKNLHLLKPIPDCEVKPSYFSPRYFASMKAQNIIKYFSKVNRLTYFLLTSIFSPRLLLRLGGPLESASLEPFLEPDWKIPKLAFLCASSVLGGECQKRWICKDTAKRSRCCLRACFLS